LLEARILSVADVFETIGSHRPYRPSLGIQKAVNEVTQNSGRLYDPDVVHACLKLINEAGYRLVGSKGKAKLVTTQMQSL
jgi:HD-GYP domain-containing protein (c-di-GMP phosphodiesterase class II)